MESVPSLEFGRDLCGNPETAFEREWLVTNGIGGFASGTVGDALTRRYHGLLLAAMHPPVGRMLLLAKLEATATYAGRDYALSANRWANGTVDPQGYRTIETFRLDGSVPAWSYAFSDALLERTIWMESGENTTYVRYALRRASGDVTVTLRALVNARDYHALAHAYGVRDAVAIDGTVARVQLYPGAPELFVSCDRGTMEPGSGWYYGFRLSAETERGLDDLEDHYHAVTLVATLRPNDTLTIVASTQTPAPQATRDASERRAAKDQSLVDLWRERRAGSNTPAWLDRLVLAADQFVVDRKTAQGGGRSIIAGYPWFGDWGRDTMIALPGLALATGRPELARTILTTFANFLDRGMLPNRFPDAGEPPEYNTVDATLWYVEAIRRYVEATGDWDLAEQLFGALDEIVAQHAAGTRYSIHVAGDGLLYAGEDGVQLTWMDAKVGDDVITPRTGKAIEINGLWYNAVTTVQAFAQRLKRPADRYASLARRARASFGKFWNAERGYCYDVIDGPLGNDASIRPNAVIAAAMASTPLAQEQRVSIVHVASRELLTTFGLRTLSPDDPAYRGSYGGDQGRRDRAYHQGTVWPWLLGPFATAHFAVHADRDAALRYLSQIEQLLGAYGVGSLPEIAEGDAPHAPRGCTAQAWSVGEILRAWTDIDPITATPKKAKR